MRSRPRNLRIAQLRSRPAFAMSNDDYGEDEHINDIAESTAPPTASAGSKGASDSGIFTVSERPVQLSSQFDRGPSV